MTVEQGKSLASTPVIVILKVRQISIETQRMTDPQLAVEMLKKKLVTEVQLKAAIDYQESVGGRLLDVMVKLGLVHAAPSMRM